MIEKSRDAIAVDADTIPPYLGIASGYVFLGRTREAEEALPEAIRRAPDLPDAFILPFEVAFLKGDGAGMERVVALGQGKPPVEDMLSHLQSLVLARQGQLQGARPLSRRAIELASARGQRERAAVWETGAAVWEGWYGNSAEARASALRVLEGAPGRHVTYAAALALGLAGDTSRMQTIADDLAQRFPEDTSVTFNYVPALRALSALAANDPSRAIEVLRPSSTYEFAQPGIAFHGSGGGFFGAMYPTYLRGQAYLALHRATEAAAEFRKMLDHPGVVLADPIGAMARLQLARALTMSGDTSGAKAAYQDLLALWKNADSNLALPKQARAELAGLLHSQPALERRSFNEMTPCP